MDFEPINSQSLETAIDIDHNGHDDGTVLNMTVEEFEENGEL